MLGIIASKRVAADKLCQIAGLVGGRRFLGPHLPENHWHLSLRQLKGTLGSGQAAAYDVYWIGHLESILNPSSPHYVAALMKNAGLVKSAVLSSQVSAGYWIQDFLDRLPLLRRFGGFPFSARILTASWRSSFSGSLPLGSEALSSPFVRYGP